MNEFKFLIEGIQNLTVQQAAESVPFKLKKYIVKRLEGSGINVHKEDTFIKNRPGDYRNSNTAIVDLFKGYIVRTHDEADTYVENKSRFDINFKMKGEKLLVDYTLYNDVSQIVISTPGLTVEKMMDKVISEYKISREKLVKGHAEKAKTATKDSRGYTHVYNEEDSLKDFIKELNSKSNKYTLHVEIGEEGSWGGRRPDTISIEFEDDFLDKGNYNRRDLAIILTKIFQDPYVKGKMEPSDKLQKKELGFSTNQSVLDLVANKKKIFGALKDVIEDIDVNQNFKIVDIDIESKVWGIDLEIKVRHTSEFKPDPAEKVRPNRGVSSISREEALIQALNAMNSDINFAKEDLNEFFKTGQKYGRLVFKRFLSNPEKYVGSL